MDLKELNKKELLKLKEDVESQLKYIDEIKDNTNKLGKKGTLSGLKKNDKIFCINFRGSKIYNMDFVKISFGKEENGYINFSTLHDNKPMGCSSSININCMDNHYFLSEFCSNMYFYTLKPENWKSDILLELDRLTLIKKSYFEKEINKFKNNIMDFLDNNEVDVLLNNTK